MTPTDPLRLAREALKLAEYAYDGLFTFCGVCGEQNQNPHLPDCKLIAALAALSAAEALPEPESPNADVVAELRAMIEQMTADAELGALVRGMPRDADLSHLPEGWEREWEVGMPREVNHLFYGYTPEEALRAALEGLEAKSDG